MTTYELHEITKKDFLLNINKEDLNVGILLYYHDEKYGKYFEVKLMKIATKKNEIVYTLHFVKFSKNYDISIPISEIQKKCVIKKTDLENFIKKASKEKKKCNTNTKNYEILQSKYNYLQELTINENFIFAVHELYISLDNGFQIKPAVREKNALLILSHYSKVKNKIYPFSNNKENDPKNVENYKEDFVKMASLFNNFGMDYTILWKGEPNLAEIQNYEMYCMNNEYSCFGTYSNVFFLIRFINNLFISYSKDKEKRVVKEFGIENLIGLANFIGLNKDLYCCGMRDDFNF
uniref:Peptidoglycan bridge formation glycyltransferase FemA/FemB family protein n=1 Tax=Parastrongyloides trichosuri TaxID=131310 RepID=A0A0N4ZH05_PARTI